MSGKKITVTVGRQVHSFKSFEDWCDNARERYLKCGVHTQYLLYVDAKHNICLSGNDFIRAKDNDSYPVKVYDVRPFTAQPDASATGPNAVSDKPTDTNQESGEPKDGAQ